MKIKLEDGCCLFGASCKQYWKNWYCAKDFEQGTGEYKILFCQKHKIGFTDPKPTEATTSYLYNTKDSKDFDIIKSSYMDVIKDYLAEKLVKNLVKKIGKTKAEFSLLDYGTGNGRFAYSCLSAFKEADVCAVDYQVVPPKSIENKNIKYLNVKDLFSINKTFDIIILRHVLEHSHNPVKLLKELKKYLSEDGILFIEVPNLFSGMGKIFGKYWAGNYVPRHIFHFTKHSLKKAIIEAGFTEYEISGKNLPIMGNQIALLTGLSYKSTLIKTLGAMLHPLQLMIEMIFISSTCLAATCKNVKNK